MKSILKIFTPLELAYFLFSYALVISLGIIYSSNIFELISTLIGLLAVSLNMKGKRSSFIFYPLFALIYGIIAFISKNYGEGILNVFYNFPLYIYTFYSLYLSKKNKENNLKIKKLTAKNYLLISLIIIFVTLVYGFVLKTVNSKLPFLNSLATSLALVSSFLASRRYLDQWFFWNGYSLILMIIWIITYSNQGTGFIYIVLNILYVIINIYGYFKWLKMSKV